MKIHQTSLFTSLCLASVVLCPACGRNALLSLEAPDGDAGGAVTVRRAFFLPNNLPTQWAAYKDGSGPWIPVQPIAPKGQEYELVLRDPSRQLGFALVGDVGPEHVEAVVSFLTVDECLRGVDLGTSAPQAERVSSGEVSWTVAGLAADEHATVSVAGQSFEAKAGEGSTRASSNWPPSGDVLATAGPADGLPTRMLIRRNLRLADGVTIPTLDFSSAEAFSLQAGELAIQGAPVADESYAGVALVTAGGRILMSDWLTTAATKIPFMSVPAPKQTAGDLYEATYYYNSAAGNVAVFDFFRSPAGHTLVLPEAPSGASVWNSGGPGDVRPTAEWPATEPGAIRFASFTQGPDSSHIKWWQIIVSPSYAVGAVTLPDLRNVAGWNGAWDLSPGVATDWSVGSSISSNPEAHPEDGSHEVSTSQRGSMIP
jgi:hypothetical protein